MHFCPYFQGTSKQLASFDQRVKRSHPWREQGFRSIRTSGLRKGYSLETKGTLASKEKVILFFFDCFMYLASFVALHHESCFSQATLSLRPPQKIQFGLSAVRETSLAQPAEFAGHLNHSLHSGFSRKGQIHPRVQGRASCSVCNLDALLLHCQAASHPQHRSLMSATLTDTYPPEASSGFLCSICHMEMY